MNLLDAAPEIVKRCLVDSLTRRSTRWIGCDEVLVMRAAGGVEASGLCPESRVIGTLDLPAPGILPVVGMRLDRPGLPPVTRAVEPACFDLHRAVRSSDHHRGVACRNGTSRRASGRCFGFATELSGAGQPSESVRDHYAVWHSFRIMRRMEAQWRKARA